MYVSKLWLIGLVIPLAACPAVKNEENDTLFSTLTATDTDPTDPGTSNVSNESGDEESEDSSATTGPEDSESGPAGPCGDGICAEPPPDSWFGPIVRWDNDGSMPPLCGEEWPDDAFTLMGGYVDPGPAECSCACGVTVSSVCAGYGYVYSDGSCSSYISMVNAAVSQNVANGIPTSCVAGTDNGTARKRPPYIAAPPSEYRHRREGSSQKYRQRGMTNSSRAPARADISNTKVVRSVCPGGTPAC